MKVYAVELTVTVLVAAEDAAGAERVARAQRDEIINEADLEVSVNRQIHTIAQAQELYWEGSMLPYGTGTARLNELLIPAEPPADRDDKTLDMFS